MQKSVLIDPLTLQQLQEITEAHELSDRDIIQTAIKTLWNDTFPQLVYPKEEYQQYLKKVTGFLGPYKINKTYHSWTGLSEGMHRLENCSVLVPASWFTTITKQHSPVSSKVFLVAWMIFQVIFLICFKLILGI